MNEQRIRLDDLLARLPPEPDTDALPALREMVRERGRKVVVLDDDPTGTQTVHGIPVLTDWSVEILRAELAGDAPAFYILTNSRSLPLHDARELNAAIGRNLVEAHRGTGIDFTVVSRSDSTLRGHFPGEVAALAEGLGRTFDGWLLAPFFGEGGRYTVDDVHYVTEGEWLIPSGQTESARDATFGYRSSHLREWVEEKSGGHMLAENVTSISIDEIRRGGPHSVAKRLIGLRDGRVCILNAVTKKDLAIAIHAALIAESAGRHFLYRTAASFVPLLAGIPTRPLLDRSELDLPDASGGLVVVGSYVPRSTTQLDQLLALPDIVAIEVTVDALLDAERREVEIARWAVAAEMGLRADKDVIVYTERRLVTGSDAESSLAIGRAISSAMVSIVRAIDTRPRYLIAKGGITSSDIAASGLDVRKALVVGQILAGVPVWQLGPESRLPGLIYVVFPGNVGGPEALAEVVRKLRGKR